MNENTGTKRPGRNGRRRTQEERADLLNGYASSGMSVWAYARSKGITPTTFYQWIKRKACGTTGAPEFAKLEIKAAPAGMPIEVVMTNGIRMRFGVELSPGKATELVKSLQQL